MIFITGDTHGQFSRFSTKNFPDQKDLTGDDYVIICGDFGGIWDQEESRWEKYWLDWFEEKPFTLLFVDGNHENYDRLNTFPVKEWHGGKVHEIRPAILHLMRGQVFEIDGKKFFAFGGAKSRDVTAGILEVDDPNFESKRKLLEKEWAPFRINHVSWWKEEMPSQEEMDEGMKNLADYDFAVDYIITHCAATSTQEKITANMPYPVNELTDYLESIKNTVSFKRWFFGHYHSTGESKKEVLLYEKIEKLI